MSTTDVEVSDVTTDVIVTKNSKKVDKAPRADKLLSMGEKQRIEKLIETRAGQLTDYLTSLQAEVVEASAALPFSGQDESKELEETLVKVNSERSKLVEMRDSEQASVIQVLKSDHAARLAQIERIKDKATSMFSDRTHAAREVVARKFSKREETLQEIIIKTEARIKELKQASVSERNMRGSALRGSFQQLGDEVRDQRNRAHEQLWTAVETSADAQATLALVPDSIEFRRIVTPGHIFAIFNQMVDLKNLPVNALTCPYCKHTSSTALSSNRMRCDSCYKTFEIDASVRKLLALPNLADVLRTDV